MYGLYGNLVQTFSTREQVSWRFLAKNQRSYTSPSVGGYRVRRWRWNVNSNERMWFKFKKASPSSKLGRRLERFFVVSFKFFSACVFINQHVYELCMIQRNAAALIPARIIFCVGEGEGELIDTPIDCSLTLFINESPTQINRHVNIPCSKKDVCVWEYSSFKKRHPQT